MVEPVDDTYDGRRAVLDCRILTYRITANIFYYTSVDRNTLTLRPTPICLDLLYDLFLYGCAAVDNIRLT